MKQILLTCSLLVNIMVTASAQVSKSEFNVQVNILDYSFKQGTAENQTNTIRNLKGMMDKQMAWLKFDVAARQAKYNSDKTDLAKIGENLNKKQTAKIELEKQKQLYEKEMPWLKKIIDDENNKLGIEQPVYKELESLTTDIVKANNERKGKIITNYNKFAETLQ